MVILRHTWERTIEIAREETRCRHTGYSFRLAARVLLYALPIDRITHTTAFVTPVVNSCDAIQTDYGKIRNIFQIAVRKEGIFYLLMQSTRFY